MNYKQYDKYVYTKNDLEKYLERFNKDIEQQKQEIIEFEKRAKERIALINNWEQQKNFIILGRTYKDGKKKGILLIRRYPDQSQRDERYEFDKIVDMRKKMLELEEKYSGVDWSKFERDVDEMETISLKVGRDILEIDKNDLILDNKACYQIITKEVVKINCKHSPVMSKKLFNDLKKCELIFTNEELKQMAIKKYNINSVMLWKFDIDRMKKMGY